MLDRIDAAQADMHGCCYSEELFNQPVYEDRSFYDLYSSDSPILIPDEVRIRIAAAFNRLPVWQDLDNPWPSSFDVTINQGPVESCPSIAWAHKQMITDVNYPVACIGHAPRRENGKATVRVGHQEANVWFVETGRDVENFFRWLIIETTDRPSSMEELAAFAFTELEFVAGAFSGIKDMSKPYRELVKPIVTHLAALSDEGRRIFSGSRDRVAAEFGPFGVDISDENGLTKSNRTARDERTIKVNGEARVFWWHTKIERHQDRIHFCPEHILAGKKILVGIFCNHLTT